MQQNVVIPLLVLSLVACTITEAQGSSRVSRVLESESRHFSPELPHLAPESDKNVAAQFPTYADMGNIYVVWPDIKRGSFRWLYEIHVGDQFVGAIDDQQFINVPARPGRYSFRIEKDAVYEQYSGLLTAFDLDISPGSLAIIRCDEEPSRRKEQTFLVPLENCEGGSAYLDLEQDGIRYCGKRTRLKKSGSAADELLHCQLVTDRDLIRDSHMVASDTTLISVDGDYDYEAAVAQDTAGALSEFLAKYPESRFHAEAKARFDVLAAKEYERAVAINTVESLEAFIAQVPGSAHAVDASGRLARLKADRARAAAEKSMQARLERDSMLSPQARRDKYMVILTEHLKRQDFQQSLFYFELLDYMDAELSPSFEHFWDEALLRTGQLELATDKLYAYINKNGSSAKYYTKALQLTAEAEGTIGR